MKTLLYLIVFISTVIVSRAQTNLSIKIERLLPTGKCDVDVMEINYPKRFQEISEKLLTAVSTNKDWWLSYVKQYANSGQALPYNAKLGITEKEYAEYLALGEQRTLEKAGHGTLQTKTNSTVYEFDGGSELPSLTGLKFNLKELTIITPFGILKDPRPTESSGGPALGAFSGYEWHLEQGDIDQGDITTASFLIGRLKPSGRHFIYYKGSVSKNNNPISSAGVVIYYDKN